MSTDYLPISDSWQLNYDCLLAIIDKITDVRSLLNILSTCRQLRSLYGNNLLDKYVDINSSCVDFMECIGLIRHGLLDTTKYYGFDIRVKDIQYYTLGYISARYPVKSASREYTLYRANNDVHYYKFTIEDYRLTGDFIKLVGVDGYTIADYNITDYNTIFDYTKQVKRGYINIIHYNKKWIYYILYNINYNLVIIEFNNIRSYIFNVIDIDGVTVDDINTLNTLNNADIDNSVIYKIKIYKYWVNISLRDVIKSTPN